MALEYIQKNILTAFREGEFNVLLHQTNCVTKDRVSGIAKDIFEEYPKSLQKHLEKAIFGNYTYWSNDENKMIINIDSQHYQGGCNDLLFIHSTGYQIKDNFCNRLNALKSTLANIAYFHNFNDKKIGIPLIASGVGADKSLKGSMRDLEYFKKFIAPTVERYLPNCKVYYLCNCK